MPLGSSISFHIGRLVTPVKNFSLALSRARIWGSPLYVLDPKLQNGQKIPKWDKRSTTGLFLGFSEHHSSTVSLVLNTATGSATPQFHVVHDELYTTISSAPNLNLQIIYEQLNQISSENDWEAELNDFRKHYQMELVTIVFLLSLRAL